MMAGVYTMGVAKNHTCVKICQRYPRSRKYTFAADKPSARPDANNNSNNVTLLLGNAVKALAEEPAGSGLRSGYGRGNLSTYNTDVDYWSFTGNAGDVLTVAPTGELVIDIAKGG